MNAQPPPQPGPEDALLAALNVIAFTASRAIDLHMAAARAAQLEQQVTALATRVDRLTKELAERPPLPPPPVPAPASTGPAVDGQVHVMEGPRSA